MSVREDLRILKSSFVITNSFCIKSIVQLNTKYLFFLNTETCALNISNFYLRTETGGILIFNLRSHIPIVYMIKLIYPWSWGRVLDFCTEILSIRHNANTWKLRSYLLIQWWNAQVALRFWRNLIHSLTLMHRTKTYLWDSRCETLK